MPPRGRPGQRSPQALRGASVARPRDKEDDCPQSHERADRSMDPDRPAAGALERLVEVVASHGGRLILVGDRAQLPPVDAGGAFAALCDRLGAVELTENPRQRTELQRAVAERLAEGRAGDAISLLAEHGRLRAFEDGADARRALIRSWAQTSLADPADAVILAHDRREVRLLSEMARAELDRAGRLSDRRLVAEGHEWAIGDRLLCRRNDYRLDVRNGTRGVVVGLDERERALTHWTDDGREVRLPADYLRHAEHGYAMTGHVSQGTTVDRTYLLATPERGGREWAFVAGSRQRIDLEVYAVHHEPERLEEALKRAWSRTQAAGLALDLAEPAGRARALDDADAELERVLPERRLARIEELRRLRDETAAVSPAASNEDLARLAELRAAVARAKHGWEDARHRLELLTRRERRLPPWRRRESAEVRRALALARADLHRHEAALTIARRTAGAPLTGRNRDRHGCT